jgi:hypothetical protein
VQTPTPTTTTAEDRSTTFRPVEGGNQMQSGERLLVEAYAAIWLILFGLILIWWIRQRQLDERVTMLSGMVARAREDAARKDTRPEGGA